MTKGLRILVEEALLAAGFTREEVTRILRQGGGNWMAVYNEILRLFRLLGVRLKDEISAGAPSSGSTFALLVQKVRGELKQSGGPGEPSSIVEGVEVAPSLDSSFEMTVGPVPVESTPPRVDEVTRGSVSPPCSSEGTVDYDTETAETVEAPEAADQGDGSSCPLPDLGSSGSKDCGSVSQSVSDFLPDPEMPRDRPVLSSEASALAAESEAPSGSLATTSEVPAVAAVPRVVRGRESGFWIRDQTEDTHVSHTSHAGSRVLRPRPRRVTVDYYWEMSSDEDSDEPVFINFTPVDYRRDPAPGAARPSTSRSRARAPGILGHLGLAKKSVLEKEAAEKAKAPRRSRRRRNEPKK